MGSVAARKFVRRTDPIASYNALDRADLPKGRRAAIEILLLIGKPSSAATIRQYAEDNWGYKASTAENVRRRARALVEDGILVEVAPDDGTGAPLWFAHDLPKAPQVPADRTGGRRRRVLRRPVQLDDVPVPHVRRLVRRHRGGA